MGTNVADSQRTLDVVWRGAKVGAQLKAQHAGSASSALCCCYLGPTVQRAGSHPIRDSHPLTLNSSTVDPSTSCGSCQCSLR